jgi:hypothetical protein
MRWLLSLIFVMVTLSSASAIETRTEFVTEEVCHAIAGCWMDATTGECPDCVTETRKIVTVIEDWEFEGIESIEPLVVTKTSTKTPSNSKICWFPELKRYRSCDWRERGNRTAAAVKRGTKECGGYRNVKWTNKHLTEYVCKG